MFKRFRYLPHEAKETKMTGKLPSKEIIRHNIALGDWLYGQPYFIIFLKSINAENSATALFNRQNTYIINEQGGLVSCNLQEHVEPVEELLKKTGDGKTVVGDKDITVSFETVPEAGKMDNVYACRANCIHKEETNEE